MLKYSLLLLYFANATIRNRLFLFLFIEPRIFTPGVKTFPAEKVRIAYAKCLTANHFGAVTRAKAIFTERFVIGLVLLSS